MADGTRSKTADDPVKTVEQKLQQQINSLSEDIANSHELVQMKLTQAFDLKFHQMMDKFTALQASLNHRDLDKGSTSDAHPSVRPRQEPLLPTPVRPLSHPQQPNQWLSGGNPLSSKSPMIPDEPHSGFSTSSWIPKVDFPHFNGEHTRGWIRKCEKWFQIYFVPPPYGRAISFLPLEGELFHSSPLRESYFIPPHEMVSYASVHMHDVAETWFLGWIIGREYTDWPEFVAAVQSRFREEGPLDVVEEFNKLKQRGDVRSYQ